MQTFYPLISAIVANIIAQFFKPFSHYFKTGKKDILQIFESGGFPSSHTSMVVGLTLAVGLQEGFDTVAFYISFVFSVIIIYDAANIRYYAGQNIALTKQLIKDLELLRQSPLSDPIYKLKIKSVLGHKWVEVFGGIILGISVASILYLIG